MSRRERPKRLYRIESGTTHGLADTEEFIALLGRLKGRPGGGFFDAGRPLFVARAPGRLDVMGGIADYSGSLVLQLPIAAAAHVALQRRAERRLSVLSLPAAAGGEPRRFEMALEEFGDARAPVGCLPDLDGQGLSSQGRSYHDAGTCSPRL